MLVISSFKKSALKQTHFWISCCFEFWLYGYGAYILFLWYPLPPCAYKFAADFACYKSSIIRSKDSRPKVTNFLIFSGFSTQDNRGHFGPFQTCKNTARAYTYCGGNTVFQPQSKNCWQSSLLDGSFKTGFYCFIGCFHIKTNKIRFYKLPAAAKES